MRKSWLAVLPLFWSCADNLPEAPLDSARLVALDFPDLIVMDWPDPLEFRVQAELPEDGDWSVVLRVSGPGMAAVDYLLLDDGDQQTLAQPGPGQADHSGDNVPGDGWFTTRLDANFSATTGSYTFRAQLLEQGAERDFREVTRERVLNRAPEIGAVLAPDTLASGVSFTLSLRASDPDGPEDLAQASLIQSGGVMRSWSFTRQEDSLFTLSVGPELAAGRQGADTLRVELLDRVGNSAQQDLVVELENGPPLVAGENLQFFQWLGDQGYQAIDTGDTIHLYAPSHSPADTNSYRLDVPVSDPQTAADLTQVTWTITNLVTGQATVRDMEDSDADGVYRGYFWLNGITYNYHYYRLDLQAFDAFHESVREERIIQIHNAGESPGQPDPRLRSRGDTARRIGPDVGPLLEEDMR